MKINKYILGLAAVVLGGFSSCNTDVQGTVYNPSYEHVSFDGSSASVSVSVDETSATIPVTITRGMVANASTFTFSAEASAEGIFSNDVNGTVSFAAGQNSTTFNVTASNLEKDQSYTYTLTLSDAAVETADVVTNVKQNKVFTIKVTRSGDWTEWEPWNKEGKATYVYANYWAGADPGLPFTYRQSLNDESKYQFRLEHWGSDVELILDYDKTTGRVTCAEQYATTNADYGDVMVSDLAAYCIIRGWDIDPETDYGKFDEEQGIITIPMAWYVVGLGSFGYKPEFVYIDGYVRADYTTSVAYFGRLTDAGNNDFLLADIAFGKDVEYVRYALVTEAEVEETIESLTNGGGEKLTEAGRVQIPMTESGTYYMVVVAFAGDKAVSNDATKLKFTSSKETAETWTAKFVGTYEYTVKDYTDEGEGGYGGWEDPGTKIDAVLYQSDSNPNRYKIAPWANNNGEDGLIFTMDDNGVITVDAVYTGYTDDTYGDLFATDFLTLYGSESGAPESYYKSSVFYFNIAYHDATKPWFQVQDTFTITGEAGEGDAARLASKANRSWKAAKHVKPSTKGNTFKKFVTAKKLKMNRK